jgi:hypothetical protein
MKAFVSACIAMLAIAAISWAVLDSLDSSTQAANTADRGSVRLN